MDILTVNYEWPGVTSNCGGGGRIGKKLAEGLQERGHTVTVVTDDADGHYATFPYRTYGDVRRAMTTTLPDVVHGQFSLPSSFVLPRLCAEYQVPLAVTAMGADVYDPTRFRLLRPVMDRINRVIFQRSNAVVAPSNDLSDRIDDRHSPQVIPYGIDPTTWEWERKRRDGPLRVLTVCRLVERKNLRVAANAIADYQRRHGPAQWRVVGKGPMEQWARGNKYAQWRGYVDDLQAEFDWADVFFLPSKHEAFGIVFLEALSAGLPVVTSDTGGQTDIVEKGLVGEYARPSAENQSDALRIVADDYEWYQDNTQGYVAENFPRSHMVDAYEQLFQQLV